MGKVAKLSMASALVLAGGLAGCGGDREVLADCAAVGYEETWRAGTRVPDAARYAAALGITASELEKGESGEAICNPGITVDQVSNGAVVNMLGLGESGLSTTCVAVYVVSGEQPELGVPYDDFIVACPPKPE